MEQVTIKIDVCVDRETGEDVSCGPEPEQGSIHPNGQPAPAAPANTTGMVIPKTSPEASGASNSSPTIEPIEGEGDWWEENKSDAVHAALDAAGMIPGIGIFADAANAIFYAAQGDLKTAGISVLAMIPGAGQGVTAAKYGAKAAETAVEAGAKAKAKQEAADAAARKADAKAGNGKDGGYVEKGKGKSKKRWTPKEVEGRKVYQRDDLFDPSYKDDFGRTNVQRMEEGLAPVGKDGIEVNLHHLTQDEPGSMVELSSSYHSKHDRTLHIYSNQWDKSYKGADGIRHRYSSAPNSMNRGPFNKWKKGYWKSRSKDFK